MSLLTKHNLEFVNENMETEYRQACFAQNATNNRTSILIYVITLIFFFLSDFIRLGVHENFYIQSFVRATLFCISIVVFILLPKVKSSKTQNWLVLLWTNFVVIELLYILTTKAPEDFYLLLFIVLAILGSYSFLYNRFILQVIPPIFLSIGTFGYFSIFQEHQLHHISTMLLLLILANGFGIILSRRFNTYRRQEFFRQKQLLDLAHIDTLTNLHNRRFFYLQADKEFARAWRYKSLFTLVLIDIDFFKKINDTYGHNIGDEYLKEFSAQLQETCRELDTICRFGGEEFILLLPETSEVNAEVLAERIRVEAHKICIKDFPFSVSLGLSELRTQDKDIESMIARADTALYQAKDKGRDCVVLSSEDEALKE